MIYNSNKIYATVWKVKHPENNKYIDLQITTSEKDQEGEYKNSSWFPRCIGKSVNTLKNLKEKDRIVITKSKFTNERIKQDDDTYKSYFRFIILEAEIDNGESSSQKPAEKKETKQKENTNTSTATEPENEVDPW